MERTPEGQEEQGGLSMRRYGAYDRTREFGATEVKLTSAKGKVHSAADRGKVIKGGNMAQGWGGKKPDMR